MLLKNVVARLITINTPDGKSYPIGPNETVEVGSKLGIVKDYVEALIESGELVGSVPQEPEQDEKSELTEELEALGVQVDNRWGIDRLRKELKDALED